MAARCPKSWRWMGTAPVSCRWHWGVVPPTRRAGDWELPRRGCCSGARGRPRRLSAASTLRNIALTAPYMHDGSIATLGEVVDHYAAGGRTIADGPFAGVGHDNPAKDKLMHGFSMTPQNRADLVAFLESLTDESLVHDPKFADPW